MTRTRTAKTRRQAAAIAGICLAGLVLTPPASAVSNEESNGCAGSQDDPCIRTGTCEIQGASWGQTVTIDRADIFDTQGWPGLCDMVHVALVQGSCEPPGAQTNVTASLSANSYATIPQIVGPLACAGEPEPPSVPSLGRIEGGILAGVLLALAAASAASRRTRARRTGRC
jgi:hypothetical protein